MSGRIITTGASVLLIATGFALANETKFDRSVGEAAARIAASKLGDIRGTIDHDTVPFLVTRKLLHKQDAQTSLLPRPAWVPPKRDSDALPPMVQNGTFGIDRTMTGSIKRQPDRIIWEKFDSDGNPID